MRFQPELLALLVILVFAALLYLGIRGARRQAAEKTHQAITLGYEEVTSRPSQLISRVESIYKIREKQTIQIDQVYSQHDLEQDFFIFDARDSSHDGNELGSEIFAVITDKLDLPYFSMTTIPEFNSNTLIGGVMEKILDKVFSYAGIYQGISRIDIPDMPDLGDQLIVFGKNEEAVRDLMDRIPISSIIRVKSPLHIAGLGNFLTVDFSQMGSFKDQEYDLITQHQEFSRILSYFIKSHRNTWNEPLE